MADVKSPAVADPLDHWVQRDAEPGVAPGPAERLRALLNTDDRFHGVDRLRGRGPAGLVDLRDAMRTYLTTGDGGALAAVGARHPLVLALAPTGLELVPHAGAEGDEALVAGVLATLHEAVTAGTWDRLKTCANPDCQWVYYDGSRNRSGRWCSMGECGDVMKARAYRRRVRAGGDGPGAAGP